MSVIGDVSDFIKNALDYLWDVGQFIYKLIMFLPELLQGLFSFLPAELTGAIFSCLVLLIIIAIYKLVRG